MNAARDFLRQSTINRVLVTVERFYDYQGRAGRSHALGGALRVRGGPDHFIAHQRGAPCALPEDSFRYLRPMKQHRRTAPRSSCAAPTASPATLGKASSMHFRQCYRFRQASTIPSMQW